MPASKVVKQTRHGQITIPKEFRDALGLADDDLLRVSIEGRVLTVEPVEATPKVGTPWAKELYDLFEPVRKSLEGYTEEEINDAIDAAVKEVRRKYGRRRSKAS